MSQNNTVTDFLTASNIHLEDVLEYIDQLHTAASEGDSQNFAGMDETEVINLLRDVIYTAQETLSEVEATRARKRRRRSKQPVLHLVNKIDRAG